MTAFLFALAVILASAPAVAQEAPDDRPVRRIEVNVGGGWLGSAPLGTAEADLRANAVPPRPLQVFATSMTLAGAPTLDVGAGVAFSRRWVVEGGVVMSHPELQASVTADLEDAPPLTIVERVDQYLVEGRLVVMLDEVRFGRTVPFVAAGAGYLRQLHEGETVIEEGQVYHVGGGVKHWLLARNAGVVRAAGLRIDARLYLFTAGISLDDDGPRSHGAISGAVFVAF